MTRVAILEPDPICQSGLESYLKKHGFDVVGVAASVAAAKKFPAFDVLVSELLVKLTEISNTDFYAGALREVWPNCIGHIVYYTHDTDADRHASARFSSASGLLLKSRPLAELGDAVSRVAAGEVLWPTGRAALHMPSTLTGQQHKVLCQIVEGLTNKEIGKALGISIETVKEHVQGILRRLGLNDRTQAAAHAVRKGWCH